MAVSNSRSSAPGLDTELVAASVAQSPEGRQRVALPARSIQGQHQLPVQLLVPRMGGGELFQFGNERAVLAQLQPGGERTRPGLQTELLQPAYVRVEPDQSGDIGQRSATPQRHRIAQQALPLAEVAALAREIDQPLRGLHIGWLGTQFQHVAP